MTHQQCLRWSLLGSLGLAGFACGGSSVTDGPSQSIDEPSGPPTCTDAQVDATAGLVDCAEGYSYRPEAVTCTGSVCNTDADCGEGAICMCERAPSAGVGSCRTSSCADDADCEAGYHCATVYVDGGLRPTAPPLLSCQTADDTCVSNADCPDRQGCMLDEAKGTRSCQAICFGCGRPFLVAAQPRVAPVVRRSDWLLT